MQLKNHIWNMC